jgi:hypothetical protein
MTEAANLSMNMLHDEKKREETAKFEKDRAKREKDAELLVKKELKEQQSEERRILKLKLDEERRSKYEDKEKKRKLKEEEDLKRDENKRMKTLEELNLKNVEIKVEEDELLTEIPSGTSAAVRELLAGSVNISRHDLNLIEEFFVGRYCILN